MTTLQGRVRAGALGSCLLLLVPGAAWSLPEPLPDEAFTGAVPVVRDNTVASAGVLADLALLARAEAQGAVDDVAAGAAAGEVPVPFSRIDAIVNHTRDAGLAAVQLSAASAGAVVGAQDAQLDGTEAFANLARAAAVHKLGLAVPPGSAGVFPAAPATCVRDVQGALDAAAPGQDIAVCAGTYRGPWVVRQHFVTLRGEQGAAATILDASAGAGIVVAASGVTVKGFAIEGATGGVGVAVGTPQDVVAGTVVQDNLVRRNAVGIAVQGASATVIAHNTIRDAPRAGGAGGVGVLVAPGSPDEPGLGTLIAANNFVRNARYAVATTDPASATVAAGNYYGAATGPAVEVAGTCVGASGSCVNAVGAGVLLLGFSPVPL